MRRETLVALAAAVASLAAAAPATAQVDIAVVRVYLRSSDNSGSEITTPALGQRVYVHVDYRVEGLPEPLMADVRATIDGVQLCGGPITFSTSTDSVVWCQNFWPAVAGTHTLRWELDSNGQISEANESNNSGEITFTTAPAGVLDLEAIRAFLRTQPDGGNEVATPMPGQQVYVHLDYRVGGMGDLFAANVRASIDDVDICTGPSDFTPGEEAVLWCQEAWPATPGAHVLRWQLDADGALVENDENNNAAQVMFTTAGPTNIDLRAVRAYLRTGPGNGSEVTAPMPGDDVYFHIDIEVTGTTDNLAVDVRALIDGEEHCSGHDIVPPGMEIIWCTDPWPVTEGAHTLRWELDYTSLVTEVDEDNNTAQRSFGAGLCTGDCSGDGRVVINELVTGVNIALNLADIDACPAFDRNGSGGVTIDELVTGVSNASNDCG